MNVVALVGRLTFDPEFQQTQGGVEICKFSIAVERSFVKTGEERKADFIRIAAFGKSAEFVNKYFKKGQRIGIEGSIRVENYTDKDGNKRTSTEVIANRCFFVESKGSGEGFVAGAPQQNGAPTTYSQGSAEDFSVIDDAEDLPF